ncbi:DUF4062 domain-containing protein [Tenacibaculum finnmarkense genomovar ulcerans]|uniref:DUF4062 domain-containing protein n=1 Tax=Tenacibaculum finnmarkense TaxID=2781243 RepID=UPI00187BA9D1|nr:DUF4062 domain-containing protein [Tenacibaculum finnmarkense]MBE7646714.1 DUF4062 domain-containing protein [Tenacibaculum finnmarkense genomovar ulcerans]
MKQLNIFKCFISSPGDCNIERESCQLVINEINDGLAKHLGINFDIFMWEYDVLPDMGKNGQTIIDEYIQKSEYDIFIGIMKNRFGHPTKKAGSGTEHEFNDALSRKKESKNSIPKILFFFGKEDVDPNNFDFEQFQKVKEFKSNISSKGLYIDYSDIESFKKMLKDKLELFIQENSPLDKPNEKIKEVDSILEKAENDLNESLKTYNEISPVWIEPIISSKRHIPNSPNKNGEHKIKLTSIIDTPSNIVIKAPSEFGLTSLAHYLKLEAWKNGKSFLFIDSKKTKKHKIIKDIKRGAQEYFFKSIDNIDCILLDSVCFEESGIMQMLKSVSEEFKDIPIIIFNTLDNNFFLKSDEDDKVEIKRQFTSYYLLPLPQNDLRKIVISYSRIKPFKEDNDIILGKVTKDLETLNMHRTPKNCISILKASSKIGNEYNPINRTKLLETILSTIFEEYEIPTYYDKKPDVKDCSFVLGYFCELLVLRNNFEFTEEYFKTELKIFCKTNFIELDLDYLINVLLDNSIFSKDITGNILFFRNSYWVFYFIAQRMNMDKNFLDNIYSNKKYIDFPEIIEFYTGIDRNKKDALEILNSDIKDTLQTVRGKVNLPNNLNPYKRIKWNPDIETLEKEEAKIGEDIISSGLPDEVKDKYDDKNYDQIRPYNQVVNSVIREYSFLVLMRQITACSRALRNSDFVNAKLKKELLDNITQAWNEINKLLIALSPILADRGNISFEGARFQLDEDDFRFSDPIEKRKAVLLAVPTNVIKFFKDDLFSSKMGPLLIDKAENETNSLIKHELMLLLIAERPKDWNRTVDKYIVNLDKNSYFLSDTLSVLNFNKDFNATELGDKRIITMLSKKCRAKHLYKKDNPDIGLINKIK